MNKTEIMNGLTRSLGKVKFTLKKHSPEILVVSGIVGTVAGTVMACKATTKLDAILEESKEKIDAIHEAGENPDVLPKDVVYTEEDYRKDLTITYVQTGLKVAKLYAPAVAVGALSIASILAGHNMLRKRNVALAAAYSVVDKSFKDYRGRVVDRFGEDLDRELRYNIKSKEVEETIIDEKGKEKKVKKTIDVVNPEDIKNEFSQFFCEGNPNWSKDAEFNKMFLLRQMDYANERLAAEGHLFLNDVYAMLGMDKTRAGASFGWVYDKDIIKQIDFNIFDVHDEAKQRFVNGWERSILVDFLGVKPILDEVYS